jgi:microcystin-dependent protein
MANLLQLWAPQTIQSMWSLLTRTQHHVGEYRLTNRTYDFDGFMLCDGRSLSRAEYHELFAVVGTIYGAPNGDSFNLPDFRARVLGAAGGAPRTLGNRVGTETITLTVPQLPPHTHTGTTVAEGEHTHSHNAPGTSQGLVTMNGFGTGTGFDNDGTPELNIQTPPVALTINNNGSHTHAFTTNATGSADPVPVMQPTLFGVNVFIYVGEVMYVEEQ